MSGWLARARYGVWMIDTKLFFQCKQHRVVLIECQDPIIVRNPVTQAWRIQWDAFLCPKHPKNSFPSCKPKWRIMIVESGQVIIK